MFRGINKRLAGIGLASVFSAYIISFYYCVVISWSVIYFFVSFGSPLPWSKDAEDLGCSELKLPKAMIYYFKNVVRYIDDDCKFYKEDETESLFSLKACGAVAVVWISIFFAIFKGVKNSSYVVWVTVPLPFIFIIIMVIKGLTLEGASSGVK